MPAKYDRCVKSVSARNRKLRRQGRATYNPFAICARVLENPLKVMHGGVGGVRVVPLLIILGSAAALVGGIFLSQARQAAAAQKELPPVPPPAPPSPNNPVPTTTVKAGERYSILFTPRNVPMPSVSDEQTKFDNTLGKGVVIVQSIGAAGAQWYVVVDYRGAAGDAVAMLKTPSGASVFDLGASP